MFFKTMLYHIRTMDMLELKGAVIFTGHSGPHARDMQPFMDLAQRHVSVQLCYFIGAGIDEYHFNDGLDSGGHAGRGETSLLWATDPDCVDLSRLPPDPGSGAPHPSPAHEPPCFAMGEHNEKSSRRAGELAVADLAAALGGAGRDLIGAYDASQPRGQAMSFGELEEVWESDFLPALKNFASMKIDRPEPPADSRWRRNWDIPEPR
jgi:hypothetical protein